MYPTQNPGHDVHEERTTAPAGTWAPKQPPVGGADVHQDGAGSGPPPPAKQD